MIWFSSMAACDKLCPYGYKQIIKQLNSTEFEWDNREMSETNLPAINALKKYAANAPHVHLGWDFGRIGSLHKHLGRQIPVGAGALRGQVHAVIGIVVVLVHLLAQTEIGYFYFATVFTGAEQNITCQAIWTNQIQFNQWQWQRTYQVLDRNESRAAWCWHSSTWGRSPSA